MWMRSRLRAREPQGQVRRRGAVGSSEMSMFVRRGGIYTPPPVFLLNPRPTPCATRCRATDSSYVGSPSLKRGARNGQQGCRPA